ncbi:MAG: flagellar biosynthetic protein FliR [Pseudomonadota bacterium]
MEAALTAIFAQANQLVFVGMGIFVRIGAAAFLVPGLGERSLSMRIRLGGALAIAILLAPMIRPMVPLSPGNPISLLAVLTSEAAIGLIIGLAFRFLVYALQIAGMVAAQHLSVAQMFGTGVAPEPEPTIATLLGMGGITLALMSGLHVHLVATLAGMYEVFPFGQFPNGADLAEWATTRMAGTFAIGVTLAAPFVAIGFAYNLALGALNRAMPQLLVALVGVPALVWVGIVVLALVLPTLMETWMGFLTQIYENPLAGVR